MQKKLFIIITFTTLALIAFFLMLRERPNGEVVQEEPGKNISELPLFSQGLAAAGINATELGFHDFSPSGEYFLFNTFSETENIATRSYILHTHSGEITSLPGVPDRSFENDDVLLLYTEDKPVLYSLKDNTSQALDIDKNIYGAILSPNAQYVMFNTVQGLQLFNRETKTVTKLSTASYDGAYAWFSDNKRIIGFKETGENLYEAGKGRALGIWAIDGTFTPLPVSLNEKSIRYISWIVPDVLARVNAGWDDGSFDYIVNVKTNSVVRVGETSQALMGGLVQEGELFAIVAGGTTPSAQMYQKEKRIHNISLPEGYYRESAEIIDENNLLYIRKKASSNGVTSQEVILLNLQNGAETVVKNLPLGYTDLSLAADKKTWVVSVKDVFYTGTL